MAANYSETEMRAFMAAQVAAGLVSGLSLGRKSSDEEVAEIAETPVRTRKQSQRLSEIGANPMEGKFPVD